MEKIYTRTKTIQEDKVSGFCPGCMHSTVMKLIGEVLEELDQVQNTACVLGIGCCGLHMDYMAYDNITAPHGRACAVATGIKRTNPESLVDTYRGMGTWPPSAWRRPFPPPTGGRISASFSSTTASTA